ncbi:MAG TPA: hypothetical protein VF810_00885 [Patescibacteria group bacterium]
MRVWIIILLSFLIYGVSLFGGFVQDDVVVIANNPELSKVSYLLSAWTEPYYKNDSKAGLYRPVTSMSFGINELLFGTSPWGFRLVNVLLYALVCWLVYVFAVQVLKDKKWAFILAILFVVHPIHTEAVNNIVGRAEILSLIFFLSSMVVTQKRKAELGALFYLLAMLSKESAIVAILPLFLIIWAQKSSLKEKLGRSITYCVSVLAYLGMRLVVLGNNFFSNNATMVENPLKFLSFNQRIPAAVSNLSLGWEKLVWPWYLSYDYSFNLIKLPNNFLDTKVIIGVLLILFSLMLLYVKRRETGWINGLMLLWLPISVTGNLIFPTGTIFGERLWFTSSLGFLLLVILWARESRWAKYIYPVLIAIAIFWGLRTVVRNIDWLSEKSLFLHDAGYARDSVMAVNNEAAMRLQEKDFTKAKDALERANKIYPDYPQLMNNWGIYYWWQGDLNMAKTKFKECLDKYPGDALCNGNIELLK